MSLAARAIRFNVSKKIAQLMKVISLFSMQLSEKSHQKDYIENYYSQLWADFEENYRKQMDPIIEDASKCNNTIVTSITESYQQKFGEMKHNFHINLQKQSDSINNTFITSQNEISKMVAQITEISGRLLRNQSHYVNCSVRASQKLEDPTINAKFQAELEAIESEANKKYELAVKEADERLKSLTEEHAKQMKALNMKFMEKTPELEQFNSYIQNAKARVAVHKDMLTITSQNYHDAIENQNINNLKSKISKEISEYKSINQNYIDKKQNIIDQTSKIEKSNAELIKNLIEELKAIKASNELKLQKMCRETEDLINRYRQEEKELTEKQYEKFGNSDKEFLELQQSYANELDSLTNKITAAESATKKLLSEKEKLITETEKSHKIEEEMSEKEKLQVITRNENLYKSTKSNMKTIVENTIARYRAIILQMRSDFESRMKSDNNDVQNARNDLKKVKEEKETKESLIKQKISNHVLETNNIKTMHTAKYEEEENAYKSNLEQKYNEMTQKQKDKISLIEKSNSVLENKLKYDLNLKYESEINKIKEEAENNKEVTQAEEKFKKEFEQLKKTLDSITPPENKNFSLLDEQQRDFSNKINQTLMNNENEKEQIIQEWTQKIEEEVKRHTSTTSSVSSGRAKDQVKKNLMNKIEEAKTEAKIVADKLQSKLNDMMKKHINYMTDTESERIKAMDRNEIEKLINEYDNELKRCNAEISDKKRQSNNEVTQFELNIGNMTNDINSRKLSIENEMKLINEKTTKKIEDSKISISLILQKEKEDALKLKESNDTTTSQENQSYKYHMDELKALIMDQLTKIEQKKIDFSDVLNKKKSSNEFELGQIEKQLFQENRDIEENWSAMEIFYNEKIEVLEKKKEEIIAKFNSRPGRPCDIDRIELLTGRLKIIITQLKNNTRDLVEYKKLLVIKEKEYNQKFGRKPNVGVLT